MVPVPTYLDLYPAQESPTKSGFPAEGAAAAPDVSQVRSRRSSDSSPSTPRHSPRLALRYANDSRKQIQKQSIHPLPRDEDILVAIIGVGFVGESLLREFSRVFPCIGYDISPARIAELMSCNISSLQPIKLTTDAASLARATHFLISVPTLLQPDRSINLDYVHSAISTVLQHAKPGSTIVLESSVSVGTTRRILEPHAQLYNIGMSPERVDPGRTDPAPHTIPKMISGLTPTALAAVAQVYDQVFDTTVPVSSPETAEMTKLYENCFRMVNIAYANEMADYAKKLGVDAAEMVDAANTKPYGFMKFSPGLGVGGHCIPVNPYYLFETTGNAVSELPVLERATKRMWGRPGRLAKTFHRRACFADAGKEGGKIKSVGGRCGGRDRPQSLVVRQPRILVVGIGFKPGQSVLSCSPGLAFAERLKHLGCERLAFYDPLVDAKSVSFMEKLQEKSWTRDHIEKEFDGVAICTAQEGVDFKVLECLSKRTFVRSYVW